jgi:hypothetical protein
MLCTMADRMNPSASGQRISQNISKDTLRACPMAPITS